jgi:hypothetical protein
VPAACPFIERKTLALRLHHSRTVTQTPATDRRAPNRNDRRRHSLNGRRNTDPHTQWRRLAWLFAGYAGYLSFRSVSRAVRRLLQRQNS